MADFPIVPQIQVSYPALVELCQQAQAAGIKNPLCKQIIPHPQPQQNSWLFSGAKIAARFAVLAAIGYGMDSLGMKGIGVVGGQLQELSKMYLPSAVHSAVQQGAENLIQAGGKAAQWVDETLNVTAPATVALQQAKATVDTTVKVAKVGGSLWLLSKVASPTKAVLGVLGRVYAYSPLPGSSTLRRATNRA
ncbi:MAG: hypothetical protein KR126chlam3_01252 [Chlamydiae bacterium]|nr:hypothetical protein [Chlamydiota bacterium]